MRRLSRGSPEGAEADVIPRIQPRVSYGWASQAKADRSCSASASIHRPHQALQIFQHTGFSDMSQTATVRSADSLIVRELRPARTALPLPVRLSVPKHFVYGLRSVTEGKRFYTRVTRRAPRCRDQSLNLLRRRAAPDSARSKRDRNVGAAFNGITQRDHHVRARRWLPGGAVKAASPKGSARSVEP